MTKHVLHIRRENEKDSLNPAMLRLDRLSARKASKAHLKVLSTPFTETTMPSVARVLRSRINGSIIASKP